MRLPIIIPAIAISILLACRIYAIDVDTAVGDEERVSGAEQPDALKCPTSLHGGLTDEEEGQMEDMQSELNRMRDETWDDRYRY